MQNTIKYYPYKSEEYINLTKQELEKKFNFTYLNEFVDYSDDFLSCKLSSLNHKCLDFVDFYLRDTKKNGVGLFSNRRFVAGEIIGLYAGEYTTNKNSAHYRKYFIKKDHYHLRKEDVVVTPRKIGNLTRFIQHAFHSVEALQKFYKLKFSDKFLRQIVLSNAKYVIDEDKRAFVIVTRDINPGDQILTNYGLNYWSEASNSPDVFNNQGEVLKLDLATYCKTLVSLF